jgi:hypothetical protein
MKNAMIFISNFPTMISGGLLVASFLSLLAALFVIIFSGAGAGFSAAVQGSLKDLAPYADSFRLINTFWTVGWILKFIGFGVLTQILLKDGGNPLAVIAFCAILIASIIGLMHGTFHMSVQPWAAEETVRLGKIPEGYLALDTWISAAFRVAYILDLLATILFGIGIKSMGLLPQPFSSTVILWGTFWLFGYFFGAGLPAILFIMPLVIGIGLLR